MKSASTTPAKSTQPQIDVDSGNHVDDALGRTGFARHLRDVIRTIDTEGGTVIGLEGEWGSGKTWLLRQIETVGDELLPDERPLFVTFNPWMVSGTAEIVEAFLIQLASELGGASSGRGLRNGAEIARKLIDYTRVLSTLRHLAPMANLLLPGSGLLLDAVGTAAGEAAEKTKDAAGSVLDRWKQAPEKLSLSGARQRVVDLLTDEVRRIVVVVDDLDRLPPAELAAMIQAVKAVADFPNLIYLLAYDPDTAAGALRAALRLRAGEGRRYLEKIVQLPMPMPEAPAFKIQAFAIDRLGAVLYPLIHDEVDRNDLDEALPLAAAVMQTPRDVARLRTQLLVTARNFVGNVNLADLVLMEAIRLKAPSVIDYIDRHRSAMLRARIEQHDHNHSLRGDLGDPLDDLGQRDGEQDQREKAAREGWKPLALPGTRAHTPIVKAMRFVFDATNHSNWVRHESHASRLRLQRLGNWVRWRTAVRHPEVFEKSDIESWLAEPELLKQSRAWSDADAFLEACALIADFAAEARRIDFPGFAAVFLEASERFGEDRLADFDFTFGPMAALEEIARQSPEADRLEAFGSMLEQGSVWLSYPLIGVAYRDAFGTDRRGPEPASQRLIPEEAKVREFAGAWTAKAMEALQALTEPNPARPAFFLAAWISHLGGDMERLRSAVSEIISNRDNGLEILFCGTKFDDERIATWGAPESSFLPDASVLLAAAEKSPWFKENRKSLIDFWRSQSNQQGEATAAAQ